MSSQLSKPRKHLELVVEDVYNHLLNEAMTLRELASATGRPYSTIQQAVAYLRDTNQIIRVDAKTRDSRWSVNAMPPQPLHFMPNLKFKGVDYRVTELFAGITTLPKGVSDEAHEVIKVWLQIARTARRLNEGTADTNTQSYLRRKKATLTKARANFEAMAFICSQMLSDDNFWNPEYIVNYPNDPAWEEYEPVMEVLYKHYFGEEED